jgi:hypothetical protein
MDVSRRDSHAQSPATSITKFFRAVLGAIRSLIVSPAPVAAAKPSPRRGGRPRKYANAKERKEAWKRRRNERNETSFRSANETWNETFPLKEEEKKERKPISENWRPNARGMELGAKTFGAQLENAIAYHVSHLLKNDIRFADYDAAWCSRCLHVLHNPQGELDLRPRVRQLGVKDCGRAKRQQPPDHTTEKKGRDTKQLKKALAALSAADNQASKLTAVMTAGEFLGSVKSRWNASAWEGAMHHVVGKAIEEGLDEGEVWTALEEGISRGEKLAADHRRLGKTTFFVRPVRNKEASG